MEHNDYNDHNITVIDGGCPMMFLDFGHKYMRWMLGVMGRLPK
jgi:Ser/Thr protein kinase RdoA (MazF antagonist)